MMFQHQEVVGDPQWHTCIIQMHDIVRLDVIHAKVYCLLPSDSTLHELCHDAKAWHELD